MWMNHALSVRRFAPASVVRFRALSMRMDLIDRLEWKVDGSLADRKECDRGGCCGKSN